MLTSRVYSLNNLTSFKNHANDTARKLFILENLECARQQNLFTNLYKFLMFFFQEFHNGIVRCSTAEHWFADSASLQSWFGTRLQPSLALYTTLMASSGNFRLGIERKFTLFFVN